MVKRLLVRKLRRDVYRRKGALLALVAIVAVGMSCYVAMEGVYRDLDNSRAAFYREYHLADFTVDLKRAPLSAAAAVEEVPNVRRARPRVSVAVTIDLENTPEPVSGRAISMPLEKRPVLNDVLMRSGTWFSSAEGEVIVNADFAAANGIVPGSTLDVLLLDKQHRLLVVGTAMSPEFVYLLPPSGGLAPDPKTFGVLYMPEDFLEKSADLDGACNQIVGMACDTREIALSNMLELLEEKLDPYGVVSTTPRSEQPSVKFLSEELKGLEATAAILPVVFFGVAALVLNVLITRMVAQQRTSIGVLRAIGYTWGDMLRHYLAYGALIGAAGAVLGAALGIWLQGIFCRLYALYFSLPEIEPHFYGDIMAAGSAVSVLFAVAGSARGAWHAVKMAPAVAMQPPMPEVGGAIILERIRPLWGMLGFAWKMIMRTIFRNPFRSTVTLLSGLVSTALLFATVHTYSAFAYLVDHEYERTAHHDFQMALRDPVDGRAVAETASLPGVTYAEGQLAVPCRLSRGPYSKRLVVTGMPEPSRLYTPIDAAGNPITVPEGGLILTRKLADILHVRPGETLRMRPLIGRRRETVVPVVALVDTYLGLSAYADIGYLGRLIGEYRVVNAVFGTTGGAARNEFLEEIKRRPSAVGYGERSRTLKLIDDVIGASLGPSIAVLVLFAGIIALGSMLNTNLVSLSEREREVGSLRVMGYTPLQALKIFAGESLVVYIFAVAAGLAAGVGLARLISMAYYTEIYRFPVVIRAWQFAAAAAMMAVFFIAAQLLIYRVIIGLDWLEVLKSRE